MTHSMTGFGAAEHIDDGDCYAVEIRSVNNRYLKLSLRLPEHLQYLEGEVERWIRARMSRGAVSYVLRFGIEESGGVLPLNLPALQAYVDQLSRVRVPPGIHATVDIGALLALPGVCRAAEADEPTRQRQCRNVELVTDKALATLIEMRRREGEALRSELAELCAKVRGFVAQIGRRAPNVVEEYHERLRTRVAALMAAGGFELEAEGLMKEVAVYAERCDITEELARLEAHLDQFDELAARDEPAGRTLEFLAQEMLREANTIASKSNDRQIGRCVVEVKGLIDRLREQVQNVE